MNIRYYVFLLSLLICSNVSYAENIAVIVNPSADVATLSKSQVEQIYLGSSNILIPYDHRQNAEIRKQFYRLAANRSIAQINAIWSKLVFSGRAKKPEQLINSKAVKGAVARQSNAIGYILESEVDSTVKVVLTLP